MSICSTKEEWQPELLLTWTQQDMPGGSGVQAVDLYVAIDHGAFALWRTNVTEHAAVFPGEPGHT